MKRRSDTKKELFEVVEKKVVMFPGSQLTITKMKQIPEGEAEKKGFYSEEEDGHPVSSGYSRVDDNYYPRLKSVGSSVPPINSFETLLYSQLNKEGNLVFSPFSIATALGMVYEGARDETASEILAPFQCPMRDYGKIKNASFHSANAVFVDQRFEVLKGFTSALRKYYKSGCIKVDFRHGAREQINDWVSSRTNDKIKDLLPVVDPNTKLILVNAIYFLGDWEEPFDPRRTTSEPFFTEGKEMKVKMMYRKMEQASYAAFNADGSPFIGEEYPKDGFQVLDIPYKGEELSMMIILPSVGSAFPKFSNFNCKQRDVHVSLPKFKMECQFELNEPLQALGMKRAFTPAAQLQGIAPGLMISRVIHKAFVEVNEQGTEAAAATVVMIAKGYVPFVPEFTANRPFMFAIRIHGHLLFMGRFVSP